MSDRNVKIYSVEGMTCEHCELSLREEVEEVAGVASVEAKHATGLLTVHGDGIDDEAVLDAVQAAGYTATGAARVPGAGLAR